MGNAIISRRGGGDVVITYSNFTPSDTGGGTFTFVSPVGSKYKFGASELTTTATETTVSVSFPLNGYIKHITGSV